MKFRKRLPPAFLLEGTVGGASAKLNSHSCPYYNMLYYDKSAGDTNERKKYEAKSEVAYDDTV